MKYLQSFLALALSVALLSAAVAGSLVSESKLTDEEKTIIKRISKVDPSFHYSDKVRRHYSLHPETKVKVPILIEFVLPKNDGLYFEEYISYRVSLDPVTSLISYAFDAGTANRGKGTIFVTPQAVIKVERSCGVTACITQILRNGKQILEEEG